MIYYADNMVLNTIREVFCGESNDVLICRDINSPMQMCYTLLAIKDRECAKKVLRVFDQFDKTSLEQEQPYLKCFTNNELLCFLFPYRDERFLHSFLEGQMINVYVREETCINLTMEVLSCGYPYPLLYLILKQGNIHLEKDNSVFLTPYLDLSELDETKTEADCAGLCANEVLSILQTDTKRKLKSFELIRKKIAKSTYRSLPELYRDIKLTALQGKKLKLSKRLKAWWRRNRDILFRILLVICVIVVIITVIVLISLFIWGDVPLFRLFEHSFDVIGTEKLN